MKFTNAYSAITMPRFVILEHDHPHRHWDFMLETDGVLRAWRLAQPPLPGSIIDAECIFDHRLIYLDYEGPVSGNRGSVVRWDTGTFAWKFAAPDHIGVSLAGGQCVGEAELIRKPDETWSFELRGE